MLWCNALVRRKEKILILTTADDDDDELLPEVDTFALFTESESETQPLQEQIKLGDSSTLKTRMKFLVT